MADPRAIHEFLTGEVEATTLLLGDFVDLDAQSGYTTYKMSVSDLGEVLLEDIEYTQDLDTVDKTITGAINEHQSVIGYSYDEYDPTTAYSTGDLCIYNNVLYKAKQATTGNLPTNTTYWEETSIADEMGRIDTALSGKADVSDIPSFTVMAGLTAQSGITNLNGGSIRIGSARLLNHNIRIDSEVSTNQKIIQLANTFDYPVSNSYIVLIGSTNSYRLTASTSGGFFATSVIPVGEYNIMGFYMTA